MNDSVKVQAGILGNENPDDIVPWVNAFKKLGGAIGFTVIDLTRNDWLTRIESGNFQFLIARPGGTTSHFKQLYDERIYILSDVLGYKVFPSPQEIYIYENKKLLSYWLKANKINCPATEVFYNHSEALDFLDRCDFPVVAKTSIGASGSGVIILRSKREGVKYLKSTFSGKGAPQRTGPNLKKGGYLSRGLYYFREPAALIRKLKLYSLKSRSLQKHHVLFQEFIPHEFEWRVVRIGDSFFAHKKVVNEGKASGTLLKIYDNPPLPIFDFVKGITDKFHFYSQAVDIFESDRGYLINEMQCFFGQSDPYQMLVDGIPGRYRYINEKWVFEAGDFASNMCYDLRLENILDTLAISR